MISEMLSRKFDQIIARYPLKRSAMVPLLLYAQDEIGQVSDEVIAEVARRVDVRPIEVAEVVSYYSMLHRQPVGKHHLQFCTGISCMLRGADEVFEHCAKKLGVGHKQTTPDGLFSLEEVECLGACCGAPALQVNYDYYENLTPGEIDQLITALKKKEPRSNM
ncbi:MAG: NAD(P)H-dependent oxidoreductase subunit E [Terriglobia bacterium]|jgi:NADH-quinone oxidoreductase subunit E